MICVAWETICSLRYDSCLHQALPRRRFPRQFRIVCSWPVAKPEVVAKALQLPTASSTVRLRSDSEAGPKWALLDGY